MFQTGKGVHQGCILSLCLLNLYAEYIMQNARLEEVHVGITISVRNVSDLKIHRWHHPYGRKWRTKEPWDESERGEWKSRLKLNVQKTKIMASGSITSWQVEGNSGSSDRLFSWAPKSMQMVTAAMELKDACSLEEKLWPASTAY